MEHDNDKIETADEASERRWHERETRESGGQPITEKDLVW
jgi:hypothetical protein